MNEQRAPGNVQATAPVTSPLKNNTMGTAAPMKKNIMETTAAAPVKDNVLGVTAAPMKNNTLGIASPMPMKSNKPGAMAPGQSGAISGYRNQARADHYHPGGYMADYAQQTMQPSEYYPSTMQQTGMEMPYTGMPAPVAPRSIFQPAGTPGQGMAPTGPQPTSIMTSGLGVRDSVLTTTDFTQGFLQTQIGRHVKIEFVIGTNMLIDREGDLVKVGTDYVIIQETETDDYLLCDIYSIKFIRFYY